MANLTETTVYFLRRPVPDCRTIRYGPSVCKVRDMAEVDKKAIYRIGGATVDDVASLLESITWGVYWLNQKRRFQVHGGHWELQRAMGVPHKADPFHPRRTEIAMSAHLISDDPDALGFTTARQILRPYIRFLVSTVNRDSLGAGRGRSGYPRPGAVHGQDCNSAGNLCAGLIMQHRGPLLTSNFR